MPALVSYCMAGTGRLDLFGMGRIAQPKTPICDIGGETAAETVVRPLSCKYWCLTNLKQCAIIQLSNRRSSHDKNKSLPQMLRNWFVLRRYFGWSPIFANWHNLLEVQRNWKGYFGFIVSLDKVQGLRAQSLREKRRQCWKLHGRPFHFSRRKMWGEN